MSDEPRRRVLLAIGIPMTALVAIGVYLWGMSRILLAVGEDVAPYIALLFAMNVLVMAGLAAGLGRRRGLVPAMAVVILVPVLAVGVVGATVGEREFHNLAAEPQGGEPPPESPPAESPPPESPPAESPPAESPPAEQPATELTLVAEGIAFDTDSLTVPANTEVTVTLDNRDAGVPHNFAVYQDESASQAIFTGDIVTGPDTATYTFTTPGPGSYYFHCDVHPNMNGTFTVV